MTSQNQRTVSLRRARFALIFSAACVLVCAAALVFFGVLACFFSAPAFLLVAPAAGVFFGSLRVRAWHRAIRSATTSPDAMRWRP